MKSILQPGRMLSLLFLLCVGGLAIMKTSDTDAWIHLSCGRLIWESKSYPDLEPFIPAMSGKPFSYSSWLFGVLYYLADKYFSTYGVILLKVLTVVSVFYVLLEDSLISVRNRIVSVLVLIVVAILIRERFVERPETFMMFFLSYSIFSLRKFVWERDRKYLYALPLIHLLWANSHSSINMMFVPFGCVMTAWGIGKICGERVEPYAITLSNSELKIIGIAFLSSLIPSFVTPYGVSHFFFASQFLSLDVFKQEIAELQPPLLASAWGFFLILFFLLISFVLARKRFSLIDLLFVAPFIYMGFLSVRFTYIFAFVAGPIIARNISVAWGAYSNSRVKDSNADSCQLRFSSGYFIAVLILLGATFASLLQVKPLQKASINPGFGYDLSRQPEGALAYMDRRQIFGNLFNRFEWGQYIEWRDFPRRVPFIDARGYIPLDLLEQAVRPTQLDMLASKYGIVAYVNSFPSIHQSLNSYETDFAKPGKDWVLVYWDDFALVYLKRGGKYDHVIQQDEYRLVKPANRIAEEDLRNDPAMMDGIINELRRNVKETFSLKGKLLLGETYLIAGKYSESIDIYSKVTEKSGVPEAYMGLGQAWDKLGDYRKARSYYENSLKEVETPDVHCLLATIFLKTGDTAKALKHLKIAVSLDKKYIKAYPKLVTAYRLTGDNLNAEQAYKEYLKLSGEAGADKYFKIGLKAYAEERMNDAESAFLRVLEINPRHVTAMVNLGYIYYDTKRLDVAFSFMNKAIEIDPANGLAHYGLATIFRDRGDKAAASLHFEKYLKQEPTGYYSRQAKQELIKLR
jgi:tetratricopeptide (TPR) repeat protein